MGDDGKCLATQKGKSRYFHGASLWFMSAVSDCEVMKMLHYTERQNVGSFILRACAA